MGSIDDAATNVEIVASMKEAGGVLKMLNDSVGGVEGVDSVMDNVKEETEKVDEVTGMVVEGGAEGVDEGEIEGELEALVEQEKPKENKVEGQKIAQGISNEDAGETMDLPSVPSAEPGASDQHVRERKRQALEEEAVEKRLSLMSLDEDRVIESDAYDGSKENERMQEEKDKGEQGVPEQA